MTKSQLLNTLAGTTATPKTTAVAFFDALVELAYKEVKKTGEFTLPGLGKMVKQKRAARLGRNPFTGQPLKIKAKTTLKFRISKTAKDAVLGPVTPKPSAPPVKATKVKAKPVAKRTARR